MVDINLKSINLQQVQKLEASFGNTYNHRRRIERTER